MSTTTDIAQDLSDDFNVGNTTVGTSAVQVIPVDLKNLKGVQLKAHADNAGVVYIGKEGSVAVAASFPLAAGEGLFIPVKDITKIWSIASEASQAIRWFAV